MNSDHSVLPVKVYFDPVIVIEPYKLPATRRHIHSFVRHRLGRAEPKPSIISGGATKQIFNLLKRHAGADFRMVRRMKSPMVQLNRDKGNDKDTSHECGGNPEILFLPTYLAHGPCEPRNVDGNANLLQFGNSYF
jgi:hypothetical protein